MKKYFKYFMLMFLLISAVMTWAVLVQGAAAGKKSSGSSYYGFCYSPFRKGQSPDKGIYPDEKEIAADLKLMAKFTTVIRTYGTSGTLVKIPALAQKEGLDCYMGIWLGRDEADNEREMENAIRLAKSGLKNLKGIIVGNEVILRGDMSVKQLAECIKRVKKAAGLPVGTAEVYGELLAHPEIAGCSDFLMAHIHPYWEGIPVESASKAVVDGYDNLKKKYPGKKIFIGETGFPSAGKAFGKAVPSPRNQMLFFKSFTALAAKNGIPCFWFSCFSEDWKVEDGGAGPHWGVYNVDGSLKKDFKGLLPEGFLRNPHKVTAVQASAPLTIYSDGGSDSDSFQPTGLMGDFEGMSVTLNQYTNVKQDDDTEPAQAPVDRICKENPKSGKCCIKISYKKGAKGWAGVYWQYPINNWGDYPGCSIKKASAITFWCRAVEDNTRCEFKAGGINNPEKPYRDSFGPLSTGILTLNREWEKHTIDLKGADLGNVIGGFCWVANESCTVYLDDIVITG